MALVELHYHEQSGQPGPSCVVNTDEIETIMDVDGHASIKLRGGKPDIYTHEAYEQVLKLIHSG